MPGSWTPACGAPAFTTGRASEQPTVNASVSTSGRTMSFRQRSDVGDQGVDLIGTQLVLVGIHFLLLAVALGLEAVVDGGADLVVGEFLLPGAGRQIADGHLL